MIASFPDSILAFRGDLITAWQEAGCEVHVAAPGLSCGEAVRERLESGGVRIHDIPLRRTSTNPVSDLALILNLYLLIRRINPEFVLSYTIKPVIYGAVAGWLARAPRRFAMVTGLGYAFTSGRRSLAARFARPLYRFALRKTEKVFFQNPDDRSLFIQLGLLRESAGAVVVNGSGVNTALFEQRQIADGALTFLMIARLLGDKGVREYAAAAHKVKTLFPDVRFLLIGWIDENPNAITQVELDAWVERGDIEFLGELRDVRPAISDCSVYVLPSYREGTPRTVLEAMSVGRPIVTTDVPGCRETVVHGENGFLVPAQSSDALADAMLRFVAHPQLARRMGLRSRQIVEERYDVHKVNSMILREMGISPDSVSRLRTQ